MTDAGVVVNRLLDLTLCAARFRPGGEKAPVPIRPYVSRDRPEYIRVGHSLHSEVVANRSRPALIERRAGFTGNADDQKDIDGDAGLYYRMAAMLPVVQFAGVGDDQWFAVERPAPAGHLMREILDSAQIDLAVVRVAGEQEFGQFRRQFDHLNDRLLLGLLDKAVQPNAELAHGGFRVKPGNVDRRDLADRPRFDYCFHLAFLLAGVFGRAAFFFAGNRPDGRGNCVSHATYSCVSKCVDDPLTIGRDD